MATNTLDRSAPPPYVGYMNAIELSAILASLPPVEPFDFAERLEELVAEYRAAQAVRERDAAEESKAWGLLTRNTVGLSRGWVSSLMFQRALSNYEIPWSPKRAAEFLRSRGFTKHPGLRNGRTNNRVLPDATKPTLYVQPDHYSVAMRRPCDIERAYARDQGYRS